MKKILRNVVNLISIIVILFCVLGIFKNHFFNNKETVVPNVINLDKDEAINILSKANLGYKLVDAKSDEVKENHVFIQNPVQGSIVKINRKIELWVNSENTIKIPNLVGKDLTQARIFLDNLGISISRIDYMEINNSAESDRVLSIYPTVGTKIGQNQKVSLLVSSKNLYSNTLMPNLIGLDISEATNILSQIGKSISIKSDANDPTFPHNAIVASNPMPGEKISEDTKISVVINTGQELDKTITEVIEEKKENLEEDPSKLSDEEVKKLLDKKLEELNKKLSEKGNE